MTLKKRIKLLLNPFLEIKNRHKKSPSISRGTLILAVLIFPDRRQPSIFSVADFTAVFEMGTGVSPQLLPPENFNPLQIMTILLGINHIFFRIQILCDLACEGFHLHKR